MASSGSRRVLQKMGGPPRKPRQACNSEGFRGAVAIPDIGMHLLSGNHCFGCSISMDCTSLQDTSRAAARVSAARASAARNFRGMF